MSGAIDNAANGRSPVGTVFYILIGPIVWAAHFSVLYFIQSMLCAHGTAERSVPIVIGAATLVAILPLAAAPLLRHKTAGLFRASGWGAESHAFHGRLMTGLAILSVAGVIWAAVPALLIDSCMPLRNW
jgi:hypothetical protein